MMKISEKDIRIKRVMIFLLSIILLLTSMIPLNISTVKAADTTITVYFDTSCVGSTNGCSSSSHSTHGWKTDMSNVYYYAFGSGGNTGSLKNMTATGKESSAGSGYLFSAQINVSKYQNIVMSASSSWHSGTDCLWQTKDVGIAASDADGIYVLDTNGYNDGGTKKQGMYKRATYKNEVDYAGRTFQLSNLSRESVGLELRYENDAGDHQEVTYDLPARTLSLGSAVVIPSAGTGVSPYTKVIITRVSKNGASDSTVLKTYVFSEGKIPKKDDGSTFTYGTAQYASDKIEGEADKRISYFYRDIYDYPAAINQQKLYIGNIFGGADASKIKVVRDNGSEYAVEAVSSIGQASYVTKNPVSLDAGEIFSIMCGEDRYNLIWDVSTNNLVTKTFDALYVSSQYKAAGVIVNGIAVNSEFYDYLYDDEKGGDYGGKDRPYRKVNEAISASTYGKSFLDGAADSSSDKFNKTLGNDSLHNKPTMYLGGFWNYEDDNYYTDDHASKEKAGRWDSASDRSGYGNTLYGFRYGANLAYRPVHQSPGYYKIYNTVAQGLVDNELGGDLESGYVLKANGQTVPFFDTQWWSDNGVANYLWTKNYVPFPFFTVNTETDRSDLVCGSDDMLTPGSVYQKYTGDYYVFDSQRDKVYLDKDTGELSYKHDEPKDSEFIYDHYGGGNGLRGIFPFNESDPGDRDGLNYGFGIKYDFDFYLNDAGTIDGEEDGIPVTFTFQGDDDVWVFLDDQLILDMGGDHKNALGEINFATKTIYISQVSHANTNFVQKGTTGTVDGSYVSNADPTTSVVNNKPFWDANPAITRESDYLKTGKHRLTMYYMERGMFNSNLFIMFNLPQDTTQLDVQEDTDFGRVNTGFLAATKIVADNDVFNYSLENKGTKKTGTITSNYKYPTYGDNKRNNSSLAEQQETKFTSGTAPSPTSSTTTVTPTDRIYLRVERSWWTNDGAKTAAWMWGDKGNKYVPVRWDPDAIPYPGGAKGMWYVDYDPDYATGMKWLRINPDMYINQVVYHADWEALSIDDCKWNESIVITFGGNFPNKNTVDDSGSWKENKATYDKTIYDYSGVYNTYDFDNGSNTSDYVPVKNSSTQGVTFKLFDMYMNSEGSADPSKAVMLNTRQYNGSGNYNILSLQYGQMGNFKKQFDMGSDMRVIQRDQLSSVVKNGTDTTKDVKTNGYNDTVYTRSVSDYYDTYLRGEDPGDSRLKKPQYAGIYDGDDVVNISLAGVEDMYGGITVAPTNYTAKSGMQVDGTQTSYALIDPNDSTNRNVHLRQVFVNAVKTADLTITKQTEKDTDDIVDTFKLTIQFTNVFGSTLGDSEIDMSAVGYYLNGSDTLTGFADVTANSGSFTIRSGDSVVIKGIPVNTTYTITEADCDNYVLNTAASLNIADYTITNDTGAIVTNSRKVGDLEIVNYAYHTEEKAANDDVYTAVNSDRIADDVDFEFTVTLTVPDGVVLGNYVETNDGASTPDPKKWTRSDVNEKVYTKTFSTNLNKLHTYKDSSDSIHTVFAEDASLKGLPFGVVYSVMQGDISDYNIFSASPVYTDGKSNLKTTENQKIDHVTNLDNNIPSDRIILKYVHNPVPIVMPTTGAAAPAVAVYFIGGVLVLAAGVMMVLLKKKVLK